MRNFSLAAAFFLANVPAQAVCLEERASVAVEARSARSVVVGSVAAQHVIRDPSDPEGSLATVYIFAVAETLVGERPDSRIHIWSDNDSSRFPLDPGSKYLLFLTTDADGFWRVDNCGNSEEYEPESETLAHIISSDEP
jgi:hypothetical protein